ncbi:MAG: DUF3618 domain-containing protein [Gaiellaceae bacterium]
MAAKTARSQDEIRRDIETEREHLAGAVEGLRGELAEATNLTGKLSAKLPLAAGAAASAGFVLAGGIGATMRYFARRSREPDERVRVGGWSLRR